MRARIVAAVVALIAVAVFADRRGVFGVREEQTADFIHLTFRFVDAESAAPVFGVHIVCTRAMQRSLCSERQGPRATTITFGVLHRRHKTWLSTADAGVTLGRSGAMALSFIHPNYEHQGTSFDDDDLAAALGAPVTIALRRAAE